MSIHSAVCVWVFGAVGDYIHPAAGSPRGEGGNVIYTLIMPAPLNTPPDRCNILDISSSFLLPISPSFPFFRLDPPYIPSPMPIFALLIMNTEQLRCRGAPVIWACEHVCVQNVQNRSTTYAPPLSLSLFLLLSPQSSPHQNASSIHLVPLLLYINLSPGAGETNPATTPQYHLPWGIKGWLSCCCLSQWDYLPPTAAHYDTCFHNLTHTLPPL